MAEQDYTEREAAEGTVAELVGTDLIRVGEQLMRISDFSDELVRIGNYQVGHEFVAALPTEPALTAVAASDSPDESVFVARLDGGDVLGAFGDFFDTEARDNGGYVSAGNVFDNRLHTTDDQDDPPGIQAGQYVLRPRDI